MIERRGFGTGFAVLVAWIAAATGRIGGPSSRTSVFNRIAVLLSVAG